jgi:tRNA 2-thiouridine synthesizing protein A
MNAHLLDLKGLKCPLPALRLRKALAGVPKGTRLYVTVTDPMAVIDIPHALNETGDRLIEETRNDEVIAFLVEKA